MTASADRLSPERAEATYIDRTIATVRNHRDADNCWPQWANIFADEIEALRADLAQARKERDEWKNAAHSDGAEYRERIEKLQAALAAARRSWNETSHDAAQYESDAQRFREALERIEASKDFWPCGHSAIAREALAGGGGDPT